MSERTEAMMVNTPIKAQQIALEELTDEMRATRPGFEWKLDLERRERGCGGNDGPLYAAGTRRI